MLTCCITNRYTAFPVYISIFGGVLKKFFGREVKTEFTAPRTKGAEDKEAQSTQRYTKYKTNGMNELSILKIWSRLPCLNLTYKFSLS